MEEKEVTKDTVYTQLYNEMRRYRDYELNASGWYTAMLVAILGFLISKKYGSSTPALELTMGFKVAISLIVIVIGSASLYSIHFAHQRLHEIRDFVKNKLEPEWKKSEFTPAPKKVTPRHCIMFVQALLMAVTCFILFGPN